jgi:ubiquinone/menaquinone biosynthesis C-methylase UbiE
LKGTNSIFWIYTRFLKYFFYFLYHDLAWTYDWVAETVSIGQWKYWITTALPYLKGHDILELGHGPGHLLSFLALKGFNVIGLDQSRQMGKMAHHSLKKIFSNPHDGYANIPLLVRGLAEYIPLPDQSIDSIIATFPTRYIFEPETLASVYRVLRPGGKFIILLSAEITGKSLPFQLARWLFQVTGESEVWNPLLFEPIETMGMPASILWSDLKNSRVLIIHAHRPADH